MTKPPAKKQLSAAIADLALQIATDAAKPDVALLDRVEAMKVLASYDVAMVKARGKEPDQGGDGMRFGDMQERLRSVK